MSPGGRFMLGLRSLVSIVALPVTATIVIPAVLALHAGPLRPGWGAAVPWAWLLVGLGLGLGAAGLVLVVATVALFARRGRGTLAPWDPPRRLVIAGPYRYVRNPMITGVLAILLGEAVSLGSTAVALWLVFFLALNLIYIPLLEEPGLERRFGDDYRLYREHVPRWLPRLRPWEPPGVRSGQPE